MTDFNDVSGAFGRFMPQLALPDIGLPFYNGYYCVGKLERCRRRRLFLFCLRPTV